VDQRRHAGCGLGFDEESFKAKDGSSDPPGPGRNGERDFQGEKRSNSTHASTTDPEAQLYRRDRARRPSSASWATR
jgi:hypothetical protein